MSTKNRFGKYVLRRVLESIPLIFVIIVLTFFIIQAAPGDPITYIAGSMEATEEYLQAIREQYGLDKPVTHQFWSYITSVLKFDLGYSLRFRQDVFPLIMSRLPNTFILMGSSLIVSSLLGIILGIIASNRMYSLTDNTISLISLASFSMPVFFLGQLLVILFAINLNWFPPGGMYDLRSSAEGFERFGNLLHHLVLPTLTYSAYFLALIFRLTRTKMYETLMCDYIQTAKAKGLGEKAVLIRHALPNALMPIVTIIGFNFAFMMMGSVLVETVFSWPGIGRLLHDAVSARDYPLLMGLFIVISVLVIIVNLLTDLIYAKLDPRVAYD